MTDKDKELIKKARSVPSCAWDCIDSLIDQAETAEARDNLKDIQSYLYHLDEAHCGCL